MKYPTIAEFLAADIDTVLRWRADLQPPQNDVERAVMRRIAKRAAESDEATARVISQFGTLYEKLAEIIEKAKPKSNLGTTCFSTSSNPASTRTAGTPRTP